MIESRHHRGLDPKPLTSVQDKDDHGFNNDRPSHLHDSLEHAIPWMKAQVDAYFLIGRALAKKRGLADFVQDPWVAWDPSCIPASEAARRRWRTCLRAAIVAGSHLVSCRSDLLFARLSDRQFVVEGCGCKKLRWQRDGEHVPATLNPHTRGADSVL